MCALWCVVVLCVCFCLVAGVCLCLGFKMRAVVCVIYCAALCGLCVAVCCVCVCL